LQRKCYGTQDATKAQEWRKFQEKLCGKVWLEANAIDRTGFPAKFRDLFVEQGKCSYNNNYDDNFYKYVQGEYNMTKFN